MIFVYCFLPILIGLIASIVKGKNWGVKKCQLIWYILTAVSMCVYLFFNFEVLYDVVGIYGFGFIMATIYYLFDFSKYDKIRREVSERILEVEIMGNQMNNNINELKMSKKRDHKIMITDEAIKKVPRIKYKEIVETEYDNLQELARQVLKISKDENDSNEVAVTYSLESAKLIGKGERYIGVALGTEHEVDPLSDSTSYHLVRASGDCVVIVLHNHPSLSAFSLSDIQFLLRYETIKMIIVVTNLGNVSYLVKNKRYDFEKAVLLFNEAVDLNNKAQNIKDLQKAADYFLKSCYNVGINYEN